MKLRIIPIKYGDCIIIEWVDVKGGTHVGILDGGSIESYKNHLRNYLLSIHTPIDFWVISHAHRDHIGGIMRYLENTRDGFPLPHCNCWITNFRIPKVKVNYSSGNGSVAESVDQGNKVVSYLSQYEDCKIIDSISTGMVIPFGNLFLTIVTAPTVNEVFEVETDTIAATSGSSDYHMPLSEFNLDNFKEDNSPTNASSVSVIVECDGKKFLWLADSQPSQYVPALRTIKEQNVSALSFDIASLAHHGSNGNTTMEYIDMIQCSKFLITANAENTHNLPNKETLARFIMNPKRELNKSIEFLVPSDNSSLQNIFQIDGDNIETKLNFKLSLGITTQEI